MRKFLWMIFILAVIAGLPYADGYLYKTQYLSYINLINSNPSIAKNFKFEIQEYRLSWLQSHAIIHLIPTSQQTKNYFSTGLILDDTIYHGPVAYNPTTRKVTLAFAMTTHRIYLPTELQTKWLGNQAGQPIIEGESIATFDSAWKINYSIAALTIPNIGTLQPNHIEILTSFKKKNGELNALSTYSRLDTFTLISDKTNEKIPDISIQSIIFNQEGKREMIGLWDINNEVYLPSLTLQWKNNNFFKVNFLQFKSQKSLNSANLYDANFTATINNIQMQYENYPAITSIDFMLSINNINPNAIADYYQAIQGNPPTPSTLNSLRQNIVTPSSRLNLDARINTSLGRFAVQVTASPLPDNAKNITLEGHLRITESLLTQLVEVALTQFNDGRIGAIVKASANQPNSGAKASTSTSTEDQAKQIIASWIANGSLLKEGNDLVSNLNYSPTETSINGKLMAAPIPAPRLATPPEATSPSVLPNTP